jgi:serine/threonine protein kinase
MSQPSWIGQTIGGRYIIEEMLGRGGMSTVYKARDPNLRRIVAVKMIHAHLSDDPRFVTRFEEEATAIAQLRHPNIVQVFDFNSDGEAYFMVMEYVPGETLQERLYRMHNIGRQLPAMDAVRYASQICDALNYAHKRGMVHRDIKPANIILDVHDQAILMDFGIVKMIGSERHTATGAVVGTAMYMSPEMIRGETPDARADIYSMGVTLYEMVNGEAPFKADSAMTLMMMHLHDPIPDLRKLRPDVPEDLIEVIEKALQKDRSDRYASAAEMEAVLHEVQDRLSGGSVPATVIEPPPDPVKQAPRIDAPATLVDPQEQVSSQQTSVDVLNAAAAGATLAEVAGGKVPTPAVQPLPAAQPAGPPASNPSTSERASTHTGTMADSPAAPASQAYSTTPPSSPAPVGASQPSAWDLAGAPPAAAGSGGGGFPGEPASPTNATAGGKRSFNPTMLLVAAGVILVLLLGAGGIGFLSGKLFGGGQDQTGAATTDAATQLAAAVIPTEKATDTPQPSPTATQTQEPPTPTTDLKAFYETLTPQVTPSEWVPPAPLFARITGITVDNYQTNYIVDYETYGYTEKLPGMHVHFFFNTVSQENAGIPGSGPWILYGGPRPFREYRLSDKPAAATQMCALVANEDHSIIPDSGNCFPLP